jgi:hypothetical protein
MSDWATVDSWRLSFMELVLVSYKANIINIKNISAAV